MRAFQYTYTVIKGADHAAIGVSCLVQDVTDQRQVQVALEKSDERLELSLDAASIGTWTWNLIDGTHFLDSRMLAISGMTSAERTGVMEDDFIRNLYPDDEAMVTEAVRRSLEEGAPYNVSYRIIRRDDGEIRHVNARALVTKDETGRSIRMSGVAIDITEQKRIEAELQLAQASLETRLVERTQSLNETNQRLQTEIEVRKQAETATRESQSFVNRVMANIVDALITIDETGCVSSFNQAAENIFGYAASAVIGQNIKMLMPGPDHSRHDLYITDYLATGRSTIVGKGPREITGRHRDGHTLDLELAISRATYGGRPLFVGALRDISKRKRLEVLFQRFVQYSPSSIVLKDLVV